MNEDPQEKLIHLLAEAVELPAASRAAFLDQSCGADAELRRQAQALLEAHEAADRFLAEAPGDAPERIRRRLDEEARRENAATRLPPATAAPSSAPTSGRHSSSGKPAEDRSEDESADKASTPPGMKSESPDDPEDAAVGQSIGRYKLLERLGEGGCGVVYVAEQTEPVRRRVALKVIKPGMDTKAVVARFEAERQALAMMDHPNIAKVLDAGATEKGRPFFVMELVRGIPITHYCDQANLTTPARLELFIKVCQAIQHAHQKGIIHRDIKPSNILVTLRDGAPVPKVIDFGIAKAMEGRLTEHTVYTQLHQFLGTPAYMSPEQAEMAGLDIDTRSDIYSLGVLLYELLSGSTPFDPKELLSAGVDAMRQIIREQEPPRPSTKLSQTLVAASRQNAAGPSREDGGALPRRRYAQVQETITLLQGDLDWIVMKCLEKDRTRRYETANGLAADLKRHLSDEPVVARPPSRAYKFQKAVRRNQLAFGAGAALTAMLVLGLAASLWQAGRANREAARALRAEGVAKDRLSESEAISGFMTRVFQSPDPARDGRTITVAETLGRAVTNLDDDLAAQPEVRARLQGTLAGTYHALGLHREAIPLAEKVRDYYLKTFGLEHTNTLQATAKLGDYYRLGGRLEEALKLNEEVLRVRRKTKGPEHPDTLSAMQGLANSYSGAGRCDEALKLNEEVLRLSRKVNGPEHPATLGTMHNLARSYYMADRKDEAYRLEEELLVLIRRVKGPEHPDTLTVMNGVAVAYHYTGRQDEALKLQAELLTLSRRIRGSEHPDTLLAMDNLAGYYSNAGRQDEALKLQAEVLALSRKVNGPEHPDTILAMNNLADFYSRAGRQDEALKLQAEVLTLSRKVNGPEHPDTLTALGNLAGSNSNATRKDEAIKPPERPRR